MSLNLPTSLPSGVQASYYQIIDIRFDFNRNEAFVVLGLFLDKPSATGGRLSLSTTSILLSGADFVAATTQSGPDIKVILYALVSQKDQFLGSVDGGPDVPLGTAIVQPPPKP